jgi:hypothetical protein
VAAIPDEAEYAAIAGPRSSARYSSWTSESTCGIIAAANSPWTIRAATSIPGPSDSEHTADVAANPATPATNTRLCLSRSPSRAPLIRPAVSARVYPDSIHSSATGLACRLAWIVGSVTFRIVTSIRSMKAASSTTIRAIAGTSGDPLGHRRSSSNGTPHTRCAMQTLCDTP